MEEPRGNYQVLCYKPPGAPMFSEVHLLMEVDPDAYVLCLKTPEAVDELIRRLSYVKELVFGNAEEEKH